MALAGVLTLLFSCFTVQSQAVSQVSRTMTNYGSIVSSTRITYFQSSFSYEGPDPYTKDSWFPTREPCGYPIEKGIWHWVVIRRSKEPYGGNMRLVDDPENPTRLCLETVLDYPGTRPLPDDQDCKLYELQHREPENYPEPYKTLKEAYYQVKVWFPSDLSVAGWRLFWQICGEAGVYGNPDHSMHPQMALMFYGTDGYLGFNMDAYYFSNLSRKRIKIIPIVDIPKDQWIDFVVYVKQGSAFRAEDGTVIVWMDGNKVLERHDLPTSTYSGTPYVIWGIGNYGGRAELYMQTLYFKDVMVTSKYTGS